MQETFKTAHTIFAVAQLSNVAGVSGARPGEGSGEGALADDPYPWILHPVLDLLFCCGGVLGILLIVIFLSGTITEQSRMLGSGMGYSLLLVNTLGQFLIASAHQPATLWRVYLSKGTRESVGGFVTICGIIALALGLIGLFNRDFTACLVRITLAWSVQHTLAQAYGVSLIYTASSESTT